MQDRASFNMHFYKKIYVNGGEVIPSFETSPHPVGPPPHLSDASYTTENYTVKACYQVCS